MALTVEGVSIPDSKLAHEITELVRDIASPLLFHHSSRVYFFGALAGKRHMHGFGSRIPTYFPNSRDEWIDQPQLNEPPRPIDRAADHWDHRIDDDHYQQPGEDERSPAPDAVLLHGPRHRRCGQCIQERHIANCAKAALAYGKGVAAALLRFAAAAAGRGSVVKLPEQGEEQCV